MIPGRRVPICMTMTPHLRARLDAEATRTATTRSATASRLLVEALESLADRLETKQNRRGADPLRADAGALHPPVAPRRAGRSSPIASGGTPSRKR